MSKLENVIFRNLIYNEEYTRKVLPYISDDYFEEKIDRVIFDEISNYIGTYGKLVSKESLLIQLENRRDITELELLDINEKISKLKNEEVDSNWLIDATEQWCKDRAIENALAESILIVDNGHKTKTKDAIPDILTQALSVSFDTHIGHDYFTDSDERFAFYHEFQKKIPFDIELLNKITKGGISSKTLNILLAGTGVGKSLAMCHFAAAALLQGKNVLYITLEMAEERIAERIDANLFNVDINQIDKLSKTAFSSKIMNLRKKTMGTLIIKEYPTASAHSGHFKSLIKELHIKKSFKPDLVIIDYLNICASARYKAGASVNSYTYVKSIAEELRGLAVEFDFPIISATQTNRSGYNSSDVDLENTSESFGLPATADLMLALISTQELEELSQIMVKQLKNRYNSKTYYNKFMIGIDRSKMLLYDCDPSAQEDIQDSGQDENLSRTTVSADKKKTFNDFKF